MRPARSAYRSLSTLQRDNRRCRACAEAGYPLESRPVFEGKPATSRAYIYGQAPGVVEGAELRPWRGRAGRALRAWLQMDEDAFYATFYCASVTRCYPGRSPAGRGDRRRRRASRSSAQSGAKRSSACFDRGWLLRSAGSQRGECWESGG